MQVALDVIAEARTGYHLMSVILSSFNQNLQIGVDKFSQTPQTNVS
jgi:hypothetical protein